MSKTEQARSLMASGFTKEALKVYSGFKLGISAADQKKIKLGYECLTHPSFYQQLGVNLDIAVREAVETCNQFHRTQEEQA